MGRSGSLWCACFVVTVGFTVLPWFVMLVIVWASVSGLRPVLVAHASCFWLAPRASALASCFGPCLMLLACALCFGLHLMLLGRASVLARTLLTWIVHHALVSFIVLLDRVSFSWISIREAEGMDRGGQVGRRVLGPY